MDNKKVLSFENIRPDRIITDVFAHSVHEYMLALDDIFTKKPDALDAVLNDAVASLVMFMWISNIGVRYRHANFTPLKYMDKLWNALVKHGWIDTYAMGTMDKVVAAQVGKSIKINGRSIHTDWTSSDNFSADFGRYVYNMYNALGPKNRIDVQQKMPINEIHELFRRNNDASFSINEYIPAMERINRHLDIAPTIVTLGMRMLLSNSTRQMLDEYRVHKDPSKFPILWERLAGHPDFGNMMVQLAQVLKTWFDVHNIQSRNQSNQNQK